MVTIFPENQSFVSNPSLRARIWLRFFVWLLNGAPWTMRGTCSNRYYSSGIFAHCAVAFAVKDLRETGGYSREEVYQMLKAIRTVEKDQGWKTPEPDGSATELRPDAVEMHPCIDAGAGAMEQCEPDDPNIACWSVYWHVASGGLVHVKDFDDKASAEAAQAFLELALSVLTSVEVDR